MTNTVPAELIPGHPDYTRLAGLPGVKLDLRYATPDNFAGRDLYTPLDCGFLHRNGAEALARSARWLSARGKGLGLLVLDAVRPQRVQEQLWAVLAGTPLQIYLAEPARGSIHSFGMAVDVTIVDAGDRELDMGTPFDSLDEKSHPKLEAQFLASREITAEQVANRELLRSAMRAGGWTGISTEWWHFDCGDRARVRAEYARIL